MNFPLSLIPDEFKNQIIYKKYSRKDLALSSTENKVVYLISGNALIVRYDSEGEHIFPYVFSKDEFLGIKQFLCQAVPTWEIFINNSDAEGYEIPTDIFEKFILPSPIFLNSYLEKSLQVLTQGNKAFYIYFKGGSLAYFAFVLDYGFTIFPELITNRYTDLMDILSVSKASLYNLTNKFIDEGIIKKDKTCLTLLDKEKLKSYYESFLI